MTESIVLSELRVDGLPAGKVVEFIARTQANQHGKCNATIELTNIESLDDIYNWQEKEISIYARGRCLFAGILTDIVLEEKNRYSLLKAELTSMSIKMDIQKKSRTFQATDKKLSDVVKEVATTYQAMFRVAEDIVIPRMLYQQNETDWEFLRRLCESVGCVLFVDCTASVLQISIGFIPFSSRELSPCDLKHGCYVSYREVWRRQMNTRPRSRVDEFEDAKVITADVFLSAGHGLFLADYEQAVMASQLQIDGDVLTNELLIRHKEGLCATAACQKKRWFSPCYLPGKVIDVKGQMIKMHFDCDEQQDVNTACWIPHENTVNNYMYSMPDVGDRAFAYYEEDGELVVLGSNRGNLGKNPDYHMPENRNITSENNMIQFQPDSTVCVAGRNGGSTSSITGDVPKGINIFSSESIYIDTPQRICWEAASSEQADAGMRLKIGFDDGYKSYREAGGTPLETIYQLKHKRNIGVKSSALCEESPELEKVIPSQMALSYGKNMERQ